MTCLVRIAPPRTQSEFALRFFFTAVGVFCSAGGLAWGLAKLAREGASVQEPLHIPPPLWVSTLLLAIGSAFLLRAAHHVRLERQPTFRRSLLVALAAGTLFVGVQTYGLWSLVRGIPAEDVATGASAFVLAAAVLHGLHFTLALLFLIFVTLRALADRYDHEYSWGVTICGLVWHALFVMWIVILAVFAII